MRFRRLRRFGVRSQPFVPAGGEKFDITPVVDFEDRVEPELFRFAKFGPVRFIERGNDPIHAVRVFVIRHTFASVEHFESRIMIAMFFRVIYFHRKTILPLRVCEPGGIDGTI